MAQIQVRNKDGIGVPLLNVRIGVNGQDMEGAYDDKFSDLQGNLAWPNPLPSNKGYSLFLNYKHVIDDYEAKTVTVDSLTRPTKCDGGIISPENDIIIEVENSYPFVQDLHLDGDLIKTEDGKEWKMCFGSNFLLPQLVAEGIDILPFLYEGLNGYRMFGTSYNPATQAGFKPFHPDNYPNWLESLSKTFDILASVGKYGQLDLFCDNNYFNKDVNFLRDLQNAVCDMLRSKKNKLYSLGNENFKNGFNADDFNEPQGLITACGSGGSGDGAPLCRGNAWRTQRQHLRRDVKMFIDIPPVEAPTYSKGHIIIFDETIGYADFNRDEARTNNKDWAYKMGRIMSAFNGGVIHLDSGGHSKPLGVIEEECKDEFVRAFIS